MTALPRLPEEATQCILSQLCKWSIHYLPDIEDSEIGVKQAYDEDDGCGDGTDWVQVQAGTDGFSSGTSRYSFGTGTCEG